MSWLRRSRGNPPAALDNDGPILDGDDRPAEHDSPALAEIFAALGPERPVRVLDLGPALKTNLEYYEAVATGVKIAHLLRGDGVDDLRRLETDEFAERLARVLPVDDEPFGLILLWDLLNYLPDPRARQLLDHLAAVAAPGARIHAMIITSPTMPGEPSRYHFLGPGRLHYRPSTGEVTSAPGPAPAQVERWLAPFRVKRSILLRHGVREFIAVM